MHYPKILLIPVGLFAILALPMAADAHARLSSADPAVGSTVAASPKAVTLHFTEALEPKFSGAQVVRGGKRFDQGNTVTGSTMRVSLKPLPAGSYKVIWHALSVDTHKTQGSFGFSVGK